MGQTWISQVAKPVVVVGVKVVLVVNEGDGVTVVESVWVGEAVSVGVIETVGVEVSV